MVYIELIYIGPDLIISSYRKEDEWLPTNNLPRNLAIVVKKGLI